MNSVETAAKPRWRCSLNSAAQSHGHSTSMLSHCQLVNGPVLKPYAILMYRSLRTLDQDIRGVGNSFTRTILYLAHFKWRQRRHQRQLSDFRTFIETGIEQISADDTSGEFGGFPISHFARYRFLKHLYARYVRDDFIP